MNARIVSVLTSFLLLAAFSVGAQDWRIMLDEEAEAALPEEVVPVYQEAKEQNDYVNYDEVAKLLDEAAEMAPDHAPLQFLTTVRARDRAEAYYNASVYTQPPDNMEYTSPNWRTSDPYIDIADSALQRLVTNPDLSSEQRDRLEAELERLEEVKTNLIERDEARMSTALPLVLKIRRNREAVMNKEDEEMDILDPRNATKKPDVAEIAQDEDFESPESKNPFSLLPGEYMKPFLPPPPAPAANEQFNQAQQARDPFAQQQQQQQPTAGGGDPALGGNFDPTMAGAK